MINIEQIEQKINKKDQKRNKIVTFLSGTYLNQIFKILNIGYGQGPSFYLFLNHQNIRKKARRTQNSYG